MPDEHIQHVVVEYASEQIPVTLEFKKRRYLSISVHPDCSVTASAPVVCSLEEVLAYLESRRAWIAKQRRYFKTFIHYRKSNGSSLERLISILGVSIG